MCIRDRADTKAAIFENLCDLYNYLDASIHIQFSFLNHKIDPRQYAKSLEIRAQGDAFDDIRTEYSAILKDQLVSGNNGLVKRKFLTYTIEADSLKLARARPVSYTHLEIDDLCAVSLKLKRLTVISAIQNFIISHSQGLYKSK